MAPRRRPPPAAA
uniref:Uncharacterized protein n=1 Tax=Arundo donax TaxID=35708 RepID=A0A0A8ZFG8_ARUDO